MVLPDLQFNQFPFRIILIQLIRSFSASTAYSLTSSGRILSVWAKRNLTTSSVLYPKILKFFSFFKSIFLSYTFGFSLSIQTFEEAMETKTI